MADESCTVTELLKRIQTGDDAAGDRLFSLVYSELHQMARAARHRHRSDHSLQSGDLIHEAYLKLMAGNAGALEKNRAFFFAAAARAMRQVLIDYDRKWKPPRTIDAPTDALPERPEHDGSRLRALDKAVDELARYDQGLAEIIEQSTFARLTICQISELHGIGTSTVERRLRVARAFLRSRIEEQLRHDDTSSDDKGAGDL